MEHHVPRDQPGCTHGLLLTEIGLRRKLDDLLVIQVFLQLNTIETLSLTHFPSPACARTSGCHTRKHVRSNIDSPPSAPFHRVGLLWNHTDLNEFQCGGTLVDYKFVLTSAHCARFKQGFPKLIVVGDSKQIVSIESVHIHPMYTPDKPENDLALLKLTKYLNPRGDMLPACLWREDEVKDEFGQMHYSTYSSRFDSLKYFHEDVYSRYVIGTKIEENGKCTNTRFRSKNLLCGQNNVKLIPTVCKVQTKYLI